MIEYVGSSGGLRSMVTHWVESVPSKSVDRSGGFDSAFSSDLSGNVAGAVSEDANTFSGVTVKDT